MGRLGTYGRMNVQTIDRTIKRTTKRNYVHTYGRTYVPTYLRTYVYGPTYPQPGWTLLLDRTSGDLLQNTLLKDTNPGTFIQIRQKVVGDFFEDT